MDTTIIQAVAAAGGVGALARELYVTPSYISQMVSGARPIPAARCPAIERATGAQVTCEQLRPDVRWLRVADATWPHPDGRPLIDAVSPETVAAGS